MVSVRERGGDFRAAVRPLLWNQVLRGDGERTGCLTLIFMAYVRGADEGRETKVIVPANTYIASILAVMRAGLRPVFCELNGILAT